MTYRNDQKAKAAFKKQAQSLKPWEEAALETTKKTERLRALRLAKEAADREAAQAAPPAKRTRSRATKPAAKT